MPESIASNILDAIRLEYMPGLLPAYHAAAAVIDRGLGETLEPYIELGRIGLGIRYAVDARTRPGLPGDSRAAVEAVARALGSHGQTLYLAMQIAEMFAQEQLDSFVVRKNAAG